jgi:hypothetical protein
MPGLVTESMLNYTHAYIIFITSELSKLISLRVVYIFNNNNIMIVNKLCNIYNRYIIQL